MLDELPRWPVLIGFAVFLLPSSDIPTRLIATWYERRTARSRLIEKRRRSDTVRYGERPCESDGDARSSGSSYFRLTGAPDLLLAEGCRPGTGDSVLFCGRRREAALKNT